MILWVTALRSEAEPLLAARSLRAPAEATPWPLYVDRDGREALVISGVGRVAVAGACGWLQGHLRPPPHAGWLNVGIAGHREGPVGRTFVAHRVVERASGRAWYPPPLAGVALANDALTTVDRPETEFADAGAYDMEAAGFLGTVARWATAELAQVVKVVSDTPEDPAVALDRARVRGLIEAGLDEILPLAAALAELASVLAERWAEPAGYAELTGRWRFSVAQQRRLWRLLERFAALEGDGAELEAIAAGDGGSVLTWLAERVERLGIEG